VWDKHAVTTLHTPLLQAYAAFPIMAAAFAPLALRDRPRIAELWRSYRPQVLGAAVLAPLAYILVLLALKFTAVSASRRLARSASCSAAGCSARPAWRAASAALRPSWPELSLSPSASPEPASLPHDDLENAGAG